jgi:hypothetical protein
MSKLVHYPLSEDSGSTAYDYSGNQNNGTINGATQGATGILGASAYSFDGTDDYVHIADSFLIGQEPATFTGWINRDGTGGYDAIYTQANPNTDDVIIGFSINSNDNAELRYVDDSSTVREIEGTISIGTGWTHVAAVMYGTNIEVYVNGELDNSGDVGGSGVIVSSSTQSSDIGTLQRASTLYFTGNISSVRVYDRVLTQAEIQYLYQTTQRNTFYTETKTSDTAISPDIEITGSLNGNSGEVYVIGSPETNSEEVKQTTLTTGKSTLSWSNTHSDFAIQVITDISDVTTRVEIQKIVLST